jgi:enoyl-CoA hydratase
LVDHVVPRGQALQAARKLAAKIMSRGSFATAAAKLLINAAETENAEAALEVLGGIAAASHDELKAKVSEFMDRKRK